MTERLVIIGNGMAPGRMLEHLFERSPGRYEVTIFNAEPRVNYGRIMLSPVLSGEKTYEDIVIHDDAWYAAHGITLHRGHRVTSIDREARTVTSAQGVTTTYDRLVIATGSKKNHELLLSLGADAVVDYNDADWPEQVREKSHDGLEHSLDCIAEKGTPEAIAKALSPTKGGHIVTLLPISDDVKSTIQSTNSKAKIESTIVYTVFQRPLPYKAFDNCGEETPEDKALWEKYLQMIPGYLEKGSIKPNRVKPMGTIEDINTGFKLQQEGKVSAEKLVYNIV